jgi:hypothetical protein
MQWNPHGEIRYMDLYDTRPAFDSLGNMLDDRFDIPMTKTVPKCKCHNLNMRWYIDRSKPKGGSFRCVIKRRASQNRYNATRYEDQLYRTADVIRKRRSRRTASIDYWKNHLAAMRTINLGPKDFIVFTAIV